MNTSEKDIRVEILNALLTTPHRALENVWPVHQELIKQDPRFYAHLAAWYADNGDVRDHKEMFVICLILSDLAELRDAGLAMLRGLPPYQVLRTVDFISGRKKTRKLRKGESQVQASKGSKRTRQALAQAIFGAGKKSKQTAPAKPLAPQMIVEEFGLFRNIPRAMKTEITRYLRDREGDADWFDGSVLSARKAMKRLYALLHVRPSERAQQILFDETPPADSRLYALRQLAAAENPAEQAAAIVEYKIPYRVASTVVRQMTPAVVVALVEQMSAQELINSLGALRRRGVFDVPEIREMIEAKLAQAKTADRVSGMKTQQAIEAAGLTGEMRKALEDVADTQIKAKGRISRPTALLVDKSASMEQAIELGKRIGAMVSAICESELYTYAFDTMAHEIIAEGTDLSDWDKAFQGILAGGATSCGIALKNMTRKKQYVEQIIMITDEQHNTNPPLVTALKEYREAVGADPSIVIVRTPGGTSEVEQQCRRGDVQVDVFKFEGDYYSLPNLAPMLSRPNKMELLMEIMDYPLPKRMAA